VVSSIDIGIAYDRPINIRDRSVIVEGVAFPAAAIISDTSVAKPVVHATIEPDVWSPVTGVPDVKPSGITPVTRRPEKADFGRILN
jgi:hypothetical protein